jgi:DNA-binding NtrC family response regulator
MATSKILQITPNNTLEYPMNALPSVLVVEDDDNLRRLYVKALAHAGYLVSEAATLGKARKILATERFDVFLCDMHLGEERSINLLREYRSVLESYGTQVIMVTGQGQYQSVADDLEIEFFLQKPVSIHALTALVSRLVPQYRPG